MIYYATINIPWGTIFTLRSVRRFRGGKLVKTELQRCFDCSCVTQLHYKQNIMREIILCKTRTDTINLAVHIHPLMN